VNAPTLPDALNRPEFVPGVFDDMPAARYHEIEAMSSGGVKTMLRSPSHFRLMRDGKSKPPNDPMRLGSAVHEGVLEPATFAERVACAPNCDKRTKEGKALWAEFNACNDGRLVLSLPDFERARRCVDAVLEHTAARALLEGARRELSLFWNDGKFQVPCKARFDIFNGGIADLKTCVDASPEKFSRTIAEYGYHIQGWHYYSGAEHALGTSPEFFAFIAVESEPPFAVAVYRLDRPSLLAGADLVDEALARYKTCLEQGSWPGYKPTIETINVPRWALRREI
jgi:exodeoxyribonuclease VIII